MEDQRAVPNNEGSHYIDRHPGPSTLTAQLLVKVFMAKRWSYVH